MEDRYRDDLKARVTTDDDGRVRQILHTDEHWTSDEADPRLVAMEYLRAQSEVLEAPDTAFDRLREEVDYTDPRSEGGSYRLSEDKRQFDGATVGFAQTFLNVPVWRTGITVTVKSGPSRVVESQDTSLGDVSAALPAQAAISRWQELMTSLQGGATGGEPPPQTPSERMVSDALGLGDDADRLRANRARFYVYRYDPDSRQPAPDPGNDDMQPSLPLPPVPATVVPGGDRLVCEVTFLLPFGGLQRLSWRGLFDVETNAVLYLRALVAGVNGLVFRLDPITSTGQLTNTADQPNATLNPLRVDVALPDLAGPVAGTQALSGTWVSVRDDVAPTVAPPTRPGGTDFDYDARTDDFAAVSAYYHANGFFSVVADLGFDLATYFDGTAFPIHVDHRASFGDPGGIEINAFCGGDAEGDGIGQVGFCLSNLGDLVNPLGRAVDKYVHWHEIGGHGILWDHVESPNFGFAHSAGDGLAALQSDPESLLRELGLVERFRYTPFRPIRWLNRDVGTGWGWGGVQDVGGYPSEEILATSHFRIYRAIGGDGADLGTRRFASRVVTYLILRTVGNLTPMTNPGNVLTWCNNLQAVDKLDWTTEALSGGAYNKVIRWAFEKQGLFQPAAAPVPVTTPGAPPDVDVYIDDGRGGEYPYQPVHWNNASMWNRRAADGLPGHQSAVAGATNFAYATLRNRGTQPAADVRVTGHHSLPGAGLTWPVDFTPMDPAAGLVATAVGPDSADTVTVGPFAWVPNINAFGHDCMLMVATTNGDPSNVELLAPGETMAEWRLVPNDNNIGQRNVVVVPAAEGLAGLVDALDQRIFWAGNPLARRATLQLTVELPAVLEDAGWALRLPGDPFSLDPGEKVPITLEVVAGEDVTRQQLQDTEERDVAVLLHGDDILLGGMIYRLDPDSAE